MEKGVGDGLDDELTKNLGEYFYPEIKDYVRMLRELSDRDMLTEKGKEWLAAGGAAQAQSLGIEEAQDVTKVRSEEMGRPPRGVEPRRLWLESRAAHLLRAVNEFIERGRFDDRVLSWVRELCGLLEDILKTNVIEE